MDAVHYALILVVLVLLLYLLRPKEKFIKSIADHPQPFTERFVSNTTLEKFSDDPHLNHFKSRRRTPMNARPAQNELRHANMMDSIDTSHHLRPHVMATNQNKKNMRRLQAEVCARKNN